MIKGNDLPINERLLLCEQFGPTVQGEGQSAGRQCYFIRTANCNLSCKWCDTKYSWDWKNYNIEMETEYISFDELWNWLKSNNVKFLVVTGGEPLLQHKQLFPFLRQAIMTPKTVLNRVEIETAGTLYPDTLEDLIRSTNTRDWLYFNISPKLENSGNPKELRYKPEVLEQFNISNRAIFKFVVVDKSDFSEIMSIINDIKIPREKVWIMAEGAKTKQQEKTMRKIAEKAINLGFNISPRLHVQIWSNRRGV